MAMCRKSVSFSRELEASAWLGGEPVAGAGERSGPGARWGHSFPGDGPPPPVGSGNELCQAASRTGLRAQKFVSAPWVPAETNFPGGRGRRRHGSVPCPQTAWPRQAPALARGSRLNETNNVNRKVN